MNGDFTFTPIGMIHSCFTEKFGIPRQPGLVPAAQASLAVLPPYDRDEAFRGIEQFSHLWIIFVFHGIAAGKWQPTVRPPRLGGNRRIGVFATRSAFRPNPIGMSTVALTGVRRQQDGFYLDLAGVDLLDGTPVLDIKPYSAGLDEAQQKEANFARRKSSPRGDLARLIRQRDLKTLLLKTGELHGHFCPGVASGVMAATYAMNAIREHSDGLENLLAIVETNNCFADGIQYVTGCSFGNNSLIYKDFGKTAFTLATRDGSGLRLAVRPDYRERKADLFAEFSANFETVVIQQNRSDEAVGKFKRSGRDAAFAMLNIPIEEIFHIQEVTVDIPQRAPIFDSVLCAKCGESIMATRIVERDGQQMCIPCAGAAYQQVLGGGIVSSEYARM